MVRKRIMKNKKNGDLYACIITMNDLMCCKRQCAFTWQGFKNTGKGSWNCKM